MIIKHANTGPNRPGKSSQFTGLAIGDGVLPATDGVIINTVTFAPGARTHWHQHAAGQILQVQVGYGLICSAGESPKPLRPGDTVWIPAGERHWHGAGPESFLTHVAISFGATEWCAPVADHEYAAPVNHDDEGEPNV